MEYLSFIDFIVPPIFLIIFYFNANRIKQKNIEAKPYYKYYVSGLFIKLLGAITICLVYVYYYGTGDTLNYYSDCVSVSKLFLKSPLHALRFTFAGLDSDIWLTFDFETGWLQYSYDEHAIIVDRLCWVLCFLSFRSFIGQTMLLAWLCYHVIWKLYEMMISEFPELQREFAYAILFVPSVVFWGSGLLKDSITFACVSLYTTSFHQIIKIKKNYIKNLAFATIASYLCILIKPYIFFALLPGTILWFVGLRLSELKNQLVRSMIAPILILISIASAYGMLKIIGNSLGDYAVDKILNKAYVTQQDLKMDYYQGTSFDIGDFDPTPRGILGKAPVAIAASLFRPFLWEAYNPGMIMSGIENLIMLSLTIYLILKLRVYNVFRLMFRHHFLFFSVSFSIFFAFSVGLTTSNFGSLVRYKIPSIPFYVCSLFIIAKTYEDLKKEDAVKIAASRDLS